MLRLDKLKLLCIAIAVFLLPINLYLNNIFLFCFIALSGLSFFTTKTKLKGVLKNHFLEFIIIASPFFLNAFGLIYTDNFSKGLDFTIRALPFFLLPLLAYNKPELFRSNYRVLGFSLTAGCLFVGVYSWGFSIIEINSLNKSWKELFGPLYSHHNLLKSLNLHASYTAICIYTAIAFLINEIKHSQKRKVIFYSCVIVVLSLFMFHLLARNAIIFYLISALIYLVCLKKWKIVLSLVIVVITLGVLAFNIKHNYLRDRLFNNLNFFEKETQFSKKDDRFDRLMASYEVFKQKPLFGYGTAAESEHRKVVYKRNDDTIALEANYNAHNQFFEYLSTFGIFGGIIYVIFFVYLMYNAFKFRKGFFIYVFIGLFFACLTESIFERSQGIIYASICITLFISFKTIEQKKI